MTIIHFDMSMNKPNIRISRKELLNKNARFVESSETTVLELAHIILVIKLMSIHLINEST